MPDLGDMIPAATARALRGIGGRPVPSVRCHACGTSSPYAHAPGDDDCQAARAEKIASQTDE